MLHGISRATLDLAFGLDLTLLEDFNTLRGFRFAIIINYCSITYLRKQPFER